MGFEALLRQVVREGDMTIRPPSGAALRRGNGAGARATVVITSARWLGRIAANPSLAHDLEPRLRQVA